MKIEKLSVLLPVLLAWWVLPGCGDAHLRRGERAVGRGEYQRAIAELSQAVWKNPRDHRSFRELGVAHFHLQEFDQAIAALTRARQLAPQDSRTLFFLGFCYEQKGRLAEAIAIYSDHQQRTWFDPMRRQLQARVSQLSLQLAEAEVRSALQQEAQRMLAPPASNTLAVLYFRNVSERPEWRPLLKGLTSILITDLGKVRSLRLVERAKIEVLLREIELSSTELYDRFSAPRAGRVLGAERVVIGGATATGASNLQLDAGMLNSATSALVIKPVRVSGRLSDILQLEKQLVFALIDQMGIRLSATEREAIQQLPTESTLAFVAFCRGLDYADSLRIPQAQQAFSEALKIDPHFEAAQQELAALTTPPLAREELVKLARRDPQESTTIQHLEATREVLHDVDVVAPPLIPPAKTGTIVVTGRVRQ